MAADEQIIKILNKQFTELEKEAINYHNNPYLPENVHQYRVYMRTLRSLLKFIKPIIDQNNYEELNELLKRQGQSLSPVRDLDVFIEKINETARTNPDLLDNYADVFQFLQEERLNSVNEQASEENMAASREMLSQAKEKLTQLAFNLEDGSYDDLIEKRFDKDKSKLKKEYNKVADSDYEQTHETRKLAKQVRYNADGFKKMLPKKKTKKVSKRAKKIQEELGVITDAHVHAEILKNYRDEVEDEELKEAFEQLLSYQSRKSE